MARLNTIAIGPGRGSAGDATYRKSRGRTILSAKIKENPSNTEAQQQQRRNFSVVSTALANTPWFVNSFSQSQFGSSANSCIHLNKAMFANNTILDRFETWPNQQDVLETLFYSAQSLVTRIVYAHGKASFYGASTRVHGGLGMTLCDMLVASNEVEGRNKSVSVRIANVAPEGLKVVSAVFRLEKATSAIWNEVESAVSSIFEANKLPYYIDGAGLAHVLIPVLGTAAQFRAFGPQWRNMADAGYGLWPAARTLPTVYNGTIGTEPGLNHMGVMLELNGEPVTYVWNQVSNMLASDNTEVPQEPVRARKVTKSRAKKNEEPTTAE